MCIAFSFYALTLFIWTLYFRQIDPSKGYKGITCFVATKDMGIKIAKKEQKLGIRASSTCTLDFDDLKIPEDNVIGGEGKGYKIAIEILNEGIFVAKMDPYDFVDQIGIRSHRNCSSDVRPCPRGV